MNDGQIIVLRIKSTITTVVALILIGAATVRTMAGRQEWEVSSSVTYVTGDYGTSTDSDLIYVPVTPQWNGSKGKLALTVPYVWIDSSTDLAVVSGVPQAQEETDGETESTEGGLGDIRIDADYYLFSQGPHWRPGVDLTADIKFPTADEDDRLGTGEYDFGLGFGLYRWLSDQWIGFADFEYNFIGEPPDRDYDDQIIYDVGVAHRTTPDWLNTALVEERTAISDGSEDSISLVGASRYEFEDNIEGFGSLELGLSDGAPDYSVTIGMEYGF